MTEAHDRAREIAKATGAQLGSEIKPPRRCPGCHDIVKHDEATPYCRPECLENAESEATQATLRAKALERDRGVCGFCGADTRAIRAELDENKRLADASPPNDPRRRHYREARIHFYSKLHGFTREELEGDGTLWEAHHGKERAAGGADALKNIITLCLPCHRKASARFARSRAASRAPRGRFGR